MTAIFDAASARKAFPGILGVASFPLLFGAIHALIDATTVMVIFSTRTIHGLSVHQGAVLVLFYDVLAFAGQAPMGWFIDRFRLWRPTALTGIALSVVSVALLGVHPQAAMIAAGIGNAAFHVGAGALSLHVRPGRATPPGIFVAPGALGLAAGTIIGKGGYAVAWPFYAALVIALALAWLAECPSVERGKPAPVRDLSKPTAIVLLLLFSIAIRSLVGKAGAYEVPRETTILFGVAAAAFAGKAMGGVLSDCFGWIAVSVGALLLSAPLLALGGDNAIMITVGMFLFQMTMPVTLVATHALMPDRPGLAFGLNCLAYIIGFLGHFFHKLDDYYHWGTFLAVILLSAAAVYVGLRALSGKVPMRFREI